jgi:hypothetical protein
VFLSICQAFLVIAAKLSHDRSTPSGFLSPRLEKAFCIRPSPAMIVYPRYESSAIRGHPWAPRALQLQNLAKLARYHCASLIRQACLMLVRIVNSRINDVITNPNSVDGPRS